MKQPLHTADRTDTESAIRWHSDPGLSMLLSLPLTAAVAHFAPSLGEVAPTLIDVGCGHGEVASRLSGLGFAVTGLDLHASTLPSLTERQGEQAQYVAGDAHALPLRNNSVGALISVGMLQYVDWRKVVDECHRVLRPGGRAVFIVNLEGNPFVRAYRGLRRIAWICSRGPLLRRLSSDARPERHLSWSERMEVVIPFSSMDCSAHHIVAPLILVRSLFSYRRGFHYGTCSSRLYGYLASLDGWLLARHPSLARLCWFGVIRVTK